jgi:hypothetical protein
MNDARRKVERDARVAVAAEELAAIVQSVVDTEAGELGIASVDTLRAALARFRKASG